MRCTSAYAPSPVCTPTRYALLTGRHPWAKDAAPGILAGDAALTIKPGTPTLPSLLKPAGYRSACIGKWHLGLGRGEVVDFNAEIRPGPLEVGFDRFFGMAATGDRVPSVFISDHRVVNLDPADPIRVSYGKPVGDEPTGATHPQLQRYRGLRGHSGTIINGIARIGTMQGGAAARFVDEQLTDTLLAEAQAFIMASAGQPFLLYFAMHEPHVPRAPHPRFVGSSGCGLRGDQIVQLDWTVGELLATLDRQGIADDTLVIFTSDNGGELEDGYEDGSAAAAAATATLPAYLPNGPFRGGKYEVYEGGVRMPFLARWPRRVAAGSTSDALIGIVDLPATICAAAGVPLPEAAAPDAFDQLPVLTGAAPAVREWIALHGRALRRGALKAIQPKKGDWQLYDLAADPSEQRDLAHERPDELKALREELLRVNAAKRTRP